MINEKYSVNETINIKNPRGSNLLIIRVIGGVSREKRQKRIQRPLETVC